MQAAGLLDYEPADDSVYKRRYFALRNLVHALEDENNMLAFKLAQITTRCRDAEIARLRSLEESRDAALGRTIGDPTGGSGAGSSKAPRAQSGSGGGHAHARGTSGKGRHARRDDVDVDVPTDPRGDLTGLEGRDIGEDGGGGSVDRAIEELVEDPVKQVLPKKGGRKRKAKGSAAAINELIDPVDTPLPDPTPISSHRSPTPTRQHRAATPSDEDEDMKDDY